MPPQAEHERQMAVEEEARQAKLQAELDQARINAGKVSHWRSNIVTE